MESPDSSTHDYKTSRLNVMKRAVRPFTAEALTDSASSTLASRSSRRTFLRFAGMSALGLGVFLTRSRVALATVTSCNLACGGCPTSTGNCILINQTSCATYGFPCPDCAHGGGCPVASGCSGNCWYCCQSNCRLRCCECSCPGGHCCHCKTSVAQFCSGVAAPLACACG
jgi:hypothetical protein